MGRVLNSKTNVNIEEINSLDWYEVSEIYDIKQSFLEKYQDVIDLNGFFSSFDWYNIKLSRRFIYSIFDKLDNESRLQIIGFIKISEKFIKKYWDSLDDDCRGKLLEWSIISESFIQEKINDFDEDMWNNYICYMDLSEEFIINNLDKIDDLYKFIHNKKELSNNFYIQTRDKLDSNDLSNILIERNFNSHDKKLLEKSLDERLYEEFLEEEEERRLEEYLEEYLEEKFGRFYR